MNTASKRNPLLTIDYLQNEHENKYFDRKSAQVRPADLAGLIVAFANAEGGTIVLGISDKTRKLEGVNFVGEDKISEFINAPKNFCKPMPRFHEEFIDIINTAGEPDRLLLLHIEASPDRVIRTVNDKTFLRIADKTHEILGENLRNLEYSKSTRHFEDEINQNARVSDLDAELIEQYKRHINAEGLETEQVLRARGFLVEKGGIVYLTNAAVLLFARNIRQFYPNCRIRFVRYDGTRAESGTSLNIVKDVNVEYPLLKIIDKATEFVGTQLREFTSLNPETGKFQTVSEYPEFAWKEGIVNAVTHREYAMSGSYTLLSMYDDRLEIESPGGLPDIVTVENIRETRYSRNPAISRVLTEFGWVRELNEGVKRIYSDMENFFLDPPEYYDSGHTVRLVLRNNIITRQLRQRDRTKENIPDEIWNQLDATEQQILTVMMVRGRVTRAELEKHIGKSATTVRKKLNNLISFNLIKTSGNKFDPKITYEINFK